MFARAETSLLYANSTSKRNITWLFSFASAKPRRWINCSRKIFWKIRFNFASMKWVFVWVQDTVRLGQCCKLIFLRFVHFVLFHLLVNSSRFSVVAVWHFHCRDYALRWTSLCTWNCLFVIRYFAFFSSFSWIESTESENRKKWTLIDGHFSTCILRAIQLFSTPRKERETNVWPTEPTSFWKLRNFLTGKLRQWRTKLYAWIELCA